MTSLRLRHSLFVFLGSSLAATCFFVACSSNDVILSGDDAGPTEAGTDVEVTDAGAPDATPDVIVDAGLKNDTFTDDLAAAYCMSVARCCFGDPNLDGGAPADAGGTFGTYDQEKCLRLGRTGFVASNQGLIHANKERVVVDQAQGLDCINKVKALTCGTITAADHRAVRASCYAAIAGTQTAGQPCAHSIECVAGHFCNKSTVMDAGDEGVCEAVRGENAPCGDGHDPSLAVEEATEFAEHVCSTRGGGETGRFCHWYDFGADNYKAPNEWACAQAQPNGANCATDAWCATGICDAENGFTCSDSDIPFPQPLCADFLQ